MDDLPKKAPRNAAVARPALSPARRDSIRAYLLSWYRHGHRDLPWRKPDDPYATWISEIMLQQTRVETVKDYFRRFMARFPTPTALAQANLDDVLFHWSGLGYYARARNLHAAACEIVARYDGHFPRDPDAVRGLPGIGPYTAGAILSLAFRQRAALVDGNVIRVLSRLFAIGEPVESAAVKRRHWELAEELVPPSSATAPHDSQNDPGDFNQGLMELGATVCLPKNPTCLVCPLFALCQGRRLGDPEQFPAKKRERQVPVIQMVTLLVRHKAQVLLTRRPPMGLWGGLWEPPTGDLVEGETQRDALLRLAKDRLGLALDRRTASLEALPPFDHRLTHRHIQFSPYRLLLRAARPPPLRLDGGYQEARWIDPAAPAALGLSAWVSTLLASQLNPGSIR